MGKEALIIPYGDLMIVFDQPYRTLGNKVSDTENAPPSEGRSMAKTHFRDRIVQIVFGLQETANQRGWGFKKPPNFVWLVGRH